jgi:CheY-like chemotaxis protein
LAFAHTLNYESNNRGIAWPGTFVGKRSPAYMKWKALVIDDEVSIAATMAAILETDGFETETASSTRQAAEILAAAPFDLLITDMKMETETSGLEVTELAARQAPRPVIVIVSAYPSLGAGWRNHGADLPKTHQYPGLAVYDCTSARRTSSTPENRGGDRSSRACRRGLRQWLNLPPSGTIRLALLLRRDLRAFLARF